MVSIAGPVAASPPPASRDELPSVTLRPPRRGDIVPGEVLVRRKPGHAAARAADLHARSVRALAVRGWELVQLDPNESVDQATARLGADPSVEEVTANHVYQSLGIPDDSLFGRQWGMQNTGQSISGDAGTIAGTPGADISAPSAWDVTTGSSSVIVAVVDSGVAATHPDLAPNVIAGQNFVGDRTPTDTHDVLGHGSHVAGIIGAAGNDGYGVTGVSQHVTILPLRALDDTGSGDTVGIAEAFSYAATHGAKVVNASLGGPDPDPVLEQAIADHPNTLFVVAAGNSSSDNDVTPDYPCDYTESNLLCVAASDQNDQLASFSNFGASSVDLAAPGENIASTYIPDVAGYGGTGYALTDSPNGGYSNNADTWASSTTIDPGGASNCLLNYKLRARLSSNDILTAETAPASAPTTWSAVDTYGGPSGGTTNGSYVSRPPASVGSDGSPFLLRFHLVSDGSGTNDGVYIDNVSVKCGSSTIYGPDAFGATLTGWTTGGTANWATTDVAGVWVYMSGTSMATPYVAGAAALIWAAFPSASVSHVKNVILGTVDQKAAFSGKTVSGGRLNVARALTDAVDSTAPTGVHLTGGGIGNAFQLATSFSLGWTATDSGTGVKSYDVRYQRAPFNGVFQPWAFWKSGVTGTSAPFGGLPGYSYCIEVRARDEALNVSAWSAPRCTAFPVNDTQLTAGAGWYRLKSSTRYLGTDSYTASKGATMTLAHAYFRRMDLVVSVCNGCGSVAVYSGSTYLGTFSTNAPTFGTRHLILVRSSTQVAGPSTITIRVASPSGRPVMIEGLGLIRY